jgi:uncharacterized protein
MAKYVLWGDYCDNVLEKRAPYRQAHLDGLAAQKATGVLVTIGPTEDLKHIFGIYDAESESVVRGLVESDPYWQNGIWTSFTIHPWIQVI